jgi:hypothetical protein
MCNLNEILHYSANCILCRVSCIDGLHQVEHMEHFPAYAFRMQGMCRQSYARLGVWASLDNAS